MIFPNSNLPPQHPAPRIRVGLLGGSFNPAHDGHLYISKEAKKRLKLDEVWWIVSPQNPLKSSDDMLLLEDRIARAKALTQPQPFIRVTDFEKHLPDNYSFNTIQALQTQYPQIQFIWMMGLDNMQQMPKWHKWREIFDLVPIAVFARDGENLSLSSCEACKLMGNFRAKVEHLANEKSLKTPIWAYISLKKHPLSATEIRKTWKFSK